MTIMTPSVMTIVQHDEMLPGVLLAGAPLDLEQRGVLVLVPLAALVAGEHRLRVQTSRHHRDGFSEKMQI